MPQAKAKPKAKAKVKQQEEIARQTTVVEFQEWLGGNQDAPLSKKADMLDYFSDKNYKRFVTRAA